MDFPVLTAEGHPTSCPSAARPELATRDATSRAARQELLAPLAAFAN